ncbi:other 1 protein kinase [Moniliophthora roreri]|nr:other 1 protein kinase [Moniliophthora roreri]
MKALRGCTTESFDRAADPESIAFARNDTNFVENNQDWTGRKPDVINASLSRIEEVRKVRPYKDVATDLASYTPTEQYKWDDIHSCWVFQTTNSKQNAEQLDQIYNAGVGSYLSHENWVTLNAEIGQEIGSVPETGVDGTASGTGKRKYISEGTGSHKRSRRSGNSATASSGTSREGRGRTRAPPAVVQVADYAAEALSLSVPRSFMMNFVVRGCTIHIWHFDHESPLQSEGFDFIKELPTFLLLLFILQRLPPTGWGFIPELDKKRIVFETSGGPMEFVLDEKNAMIHSHYGLSGRCTQVLKGTVDGQVAVMKISHPEISRPPEQAVISVARKRCEFVGSDADDALKCLPEVLCSQDLEEFRTDCIRKKLSVKGKPNATRIPRAIVFPFYEPITSRTKDMPTFFVDYRKIMLAHAIFWFLGVEHGDISEANLRFCTKTSWPKLCDWDLSHFTGEPRPAGFSNTGTLIFMASELLTGSARMGQVMRVYRHDAESLFWVLIWILGRYRNGTLIEKPQFELWKQGNWQQIAKQREDEIDELRVNVDAFGSLFAGIDQALQGDVWFLRRPFTEASNAIRKIADDKVYFRVRQLLTPEKQVELQESLKRYSSLDFIEEVFKEGFFDGSQEREKAFALLENKPIFEAAIKASPAPRVRY